MLFIHHAAVYPGSPTWSSLKLGGVIILTSIVSVAFANTSSRREDTRDEVELQETVTVDQTLANKKLIQGNLTNGLYYADGGKTQKIILTEIDAITGIGLSASKGSNARGLFTAKTIANAPASTVQNLDISSKTISSSNQLRRRSINRAA